MGDLEERLPDEVVIENILDLLSGRYKGIVESAKSMGSAVLRLCGERNFCETAGLNYKNIQPEDSALIREAVGRYMK